MSKEVIEAWKVLDKVGKPEMTFQVIRNDDYGQEKLKIIIDLIESMPSFNARDNNLVAKTFKDFYEELPKAYYNENNPNNGNYIFDEIILHGDDYIFLRGIQLNNLNEDTIKELKNKIYLYGKKIKADVHELLVEDNGYTTSYTIKFWWD